jgi:hypothetical protein
MITDRVPLLYTILDGVIEGDTVWTYRLAGGLVVTSAAGSGASARAEKPFYAR